MIPWHVVGHGLFHALKAVWDEYEDSNASSSLTSQKEEKGFIWVSQELRENANKTINTVIDCVENGTTIPDELYQTHKERITEMLKTCNRLDLLPKKANVTPTENQ